MRADALRNRDKLLAAATEAFATDGEDVPLETVAARAGVGIGTLYRHFPGLHREQLRCRGAQCVHLVLVRRDDQRVPIPGRSVRVTVAAPACRSGGSSV